MILFIMVIELRGVQFGLKSYAQFKRVRFEITSMISDQNCTPLITAIIRLRRIIRLNG